MFKLSTKRKGNTEFWSEVHKNKRDATKMNELFTWLLARDISEFDPERRPKTKAYSIALSCAVPIHARYLNEVLRGNSYPFMEKGELMCIKAKDLYSHYEKWAISHSFIGIGASRANPSRGNCSSTTRSRSTRACASNPTPSTRS